MPNNRKISAADVLRIAIANPDVTVPQEALDALKPAKRSKYGNERCEFDGLKFASKAEMARYGTLRLLQMTGHISNLETQPVFVLTGKVKYKGDFRYVEDGRVIVEDVKGGRNGKATQTRTFINKWKQVQELYPDIQFRIVAK